ncbi:MAG: c-type cytochrome [Planctomycetaceae bacterium]|nr:c-type cytochrome [Planctomycetaceae bacterium]
MLRSLQQLTGLAVFLLLTLFANLHASVAAPLLLDSISHRSPVGLLLSSDEKWAVTVNQSSHSVTLVDLTSHSCVDEQPAGIDPVSLCWIEPDRTLAVSSRVSGQIHLFKLEGKQLFPAGQIEVGFEPMGIVSTSAGQLGYVSLTATGEIAEVDFTRLQVTRKFPVGQWPRWLALTADGSRLAVGLSGESRIAVVDVASGETLYKEKLVGGINLGQMECIGDYVYFPWMVYRSNPINVGNIQRGWVLASRIGRVRLDGPEYREAISLDVPRLAVADPHGLAFHSEQNRLVVSSSGTHELLVYRHHDLPFEGVGGPGDLIDRALQNDRERFKRIEVGGRPMGIRFGSQSGLLYVANSLRDSLQIVNLESGQIVQEIKIGTAPEESLVRRGEAIFYDARYSLDQWYSCHSCHQEGGTNSRAMDTHNDGSELTMKTVLPLQDVTRTAPWTWHGWQTGFDDALQKSFTSTMQGRALQSEELVAVREYLASLTASQSPFRREDGSLSPLAEQGKELFHSSRTGCSQCHSGPHLTDGEIHDVGLGSPQDVYSGYNTPSLRGIYRKVRFLHDGRASSLEEVLQDYHHPEVLNGGAKLSETEIEQIVAYLKSL